MGSLQVSARFITVRNVKVNFILEHAIKDQSGSRDIAVLFL
jgi:hypothetical protein